ncbi:hypothetical protein ElyMa_001320700 [Elysia marginata]|uniref:Uncharacterized protein n=1 Tax=Elysia marginata TaxID=1093978 RepID=A0AAV4IEM5_9GAST|nr:hypothetical protein ElyMa_001320700 [Elysia marginata]
MAISLAPREFSGTQRCHNADYICHAMLKPNGQNLLDNPAPGRADGDCHKSCMSSHLRILVLGWDDDIIKTGNSLLGRKVFDEEQKTYQRDRVALANCRTLHVTVALGPQVTEVQVVRTVCLISLSRTSTPLTTML